MSNEIRPSWQSTVSSVRSAAYSLKSAYNLRNTAEAAPCSSGAAYEVTLSVRAPANPLYGSGEETAEIGVMQPRQ